MAAKPKQTGHRKREGAAVEEGEFSEGVYRPRFPEKEAGGELQGCRLSWQGEGVCQGQL